MPTTSCSRKQRFKPMILTCQKSAVTTERWVIVSFSEAFKSIIAEQERMRKTYPRNLYWPLVKVLARNWDILVQIPTIVKAERRFKSRSTMSHMTASTTWSGHRSSEILLLFLLNLFCLAETIHCNQQKLVNNFEPTKTSIWGKYSPNKCSAKKIPPGF